MHTCTPSCLRGSNHAHVSSSGPVRRRRPLLRRAGRSRQHGPRRRRLHRHHAPLRREGRPDGPIECDIVGDLYVPTSASPTNRVPAILTTNGFGGSKDDQAGIGKAFANRGYAVLSYSGLGFGGSDCKITLDDPDYDGKAAKQLVGYLGGKSGVAFTDDAHKNPAPVLDVVKRDGLRERARPSGRHGRRLVRRPGAVRRGRHRQAHRHDRAADHLERPLLQLRAEQHVAAEARARRRQHQHSRRRQAGLGARLLRPRRRRRRAERPDRPRTPARLPELLDLRVPDARRTPPRPAP